MRHKIQSVKNYWHLSLSCSPLTEKWNKEIIIQINKSFKYRQEDNNLQHFLLFILPLKLSHLSKDWNQIFPMPCNPREVMLLYNLSFFFFSFTEWNQNQNMTLLFPKDFSPFFFNWRVTALPCCVSFCHTRIGINFYISLYNQSIIIYKFIYNICSLFLELPFTILSHPSR